MVLRKLLFLLVCLTALTQFELAQANDQKELTNYYHDVFLGEKRTDNYSGPLDPRSVYSDKVGTLILLDDLFKEQYINQQIQEEAFGLHRYWFSEVVEKSTCPDITLGENLDYIRYLYRLVTMSYLFEGLKLSNKLAVELGDKKICAISYKEIFGSCSPQSADMKKFHTRVYGKFVNEIDKLKYQTFSKSDIQSFLAEFYASSSLSTDPVYSRFHDWCISNKKNCRSLSLAEIKTGLGNFCENDKQVIQQICSEKDSFYGLSLIEKPSDLIKTSNAFNLINQSGMGEECLRRYSKIFASKETSYPQLIKQYPLLYSHLVKNNSRYIQGELFLPGALKEFDMKGLSDFLSALKPPKVEPVIVQIKRKPKPKPAPVVVVAPKPVETAPAVAIAPPPEPAKPKVSEFERAAFAIKSGDVDGIRLDMDIFRDDFEFSSEMIVELSAPIKKFQTRSALLDMKAYDLLGTLQTPVGLVFLKFLIDTENHQGLYNIVTVLGDKFYVVNDLEKKKEAQYMELRNDSTTGNRWTITLLKLPKK
jgi:hypothetical protein